MVSQLKDKVSSVKQYNNILRQLKEKGTPKSFSHPKFDWHLNIGFSTHRGFSLLSAYYPEQGCREIRSSTLPSETVLGSQAALR